MKYFFIVLFSVFSLYLGNAQEYVKHKVAKSETVTQIAKKYNVTPFDIYRLNPDAKNGVKENDLLLIPSAQAKTAAVAAKPRTHLVEQGETLYSIARKYDVNVKDLEKVNADAIREGLKKGQIVSIPGGTVDVHRESAAVSKPVDSKMASAVDTHLVAAGETKYSIAKKIQHDGGRTRETESINSLRTADRRDTSRKGRRARNASRRKAEAENTGNYRFGTYGNRSREKDHERRLCQLRGQGRRDAFRIGQIL